MGFRGDGDSKPVPTDEEGQDVDTKGKKAKDSGMLQDFAFLRGTAEGEQRLRRQEEGNPTSKHIERESESPADLSVWLAQRLLNKDEKLILDCGQKIHELNYLSRSSAYDQL